jgi:hypothetical protein
VIVLTGVNLWWLWHIRSGYPLNVDEAGYVTMALNDTIGLRAEGFLGLARAFLLQGWYAPLVPLLTVPAYLIFGDQILPSFVPVQAFFVLLVLATYGLGKRLASPGMGLVMASVVAASPGITEYARMYHFAVPSAALYTAAAYALLRSEGISNRPWALVWGLLLGLIALTRTVMLAFVPGLVIAAVLLVVMNQQRRAHAFNLGLGLVVAAATAGIWYWKNLGLVLEYLFSFGYGKNSEFYGVARSATSPDFWLMRLVSLVAEGFYLPFAALLIVALVSGLAAMVYLRATTRIPVRVWSQRRTEMLVLLTMFAQGYLVLTSSRNSGSGFILLLLPLAVVFALVALCQVPSRFWKALLTASLILVAAINIGMELPQFPGLAEPRSVSIPGFGRFEITDGRADIQKVLAESGYDAGAPASGAPAMHTGWMRADEQVASFLREFAAAHDRRPIVWFASRDPFFNTNSVELAGLIHLSEYLPMGQLSAVTRGDRADAYRAAIAMAGSSQPNFMVASDPGEAEFGPRITQAYAEEAAQSLGYNLVKRFALPDGREVRIWWLDR